MSWFQFHSIPFLFPFSYYHSVHVVERKSRENRMISVIKESRMRIVRNICNKLFPRRNVGIIPLLRPSTAWSAWYSGSSPAVLLWLPPTDRIRTSREPLHLNQRRSWRFHCPYLVRWCWLPLMPYVAIVQTRERRRRKWRWGPRRLARQVLTGKASLLSQSQWRQFPRAIRETWREEQSKRKPEWRQ